MRDNQVKTALPIRKPDSQAANHEKRSEWMESRPGERFRICTSAEETNGAYSVVEIIAEPGYGTPVHIHKNEDEHFIVLEGTARMMNGDESFQATAGAAISLRKGIAHAWCNPSNSPLRLVVTSVPGGIEEVLRLAANGADIAALAERFAVRVIGPMT